MATGSSSGLALQLGLPLRSHLQSTGADGQPRALSQREYYIPGSVLQVAVDKSRPLAWGLPQRLDVYFSDGRWDNAPVFDLPAGRTDIRPLLRFDTATPLRSGWAWGPRRTPAPGSPNSATATALPTATWTSCCGVSTWCRRPSP